MQDGEETWHVALSKQPSMKEYTKITPEHMNASDLSQDPSNWWLFIHVENRHGAQLWHFANVRLHLTALGGTTKNVVFFLFPHALSPFNSISSHVATPMLYDWQSRDLTTLCRGLPSSSLHGIF